MTALFFLWAATAAADCTVLSRASLHLPNGPVTDAAIVIDGERIAAVGASIAGLVVDEGRRSATYRGRDCAHEVLTGRQITAGFIEARSRLGLVEVGLEAATNDHDGGGDPVRSAFRVADGYNPRSSLVPIQRMAGVTGAVITPSGGTIGGQAAYVALRGASQAEAVVNPSVAMMAHVGGPSRGAGLLALREVLGDAAAYRRNRAAWGRNQSRSFVEGASHLDLEALLPVLDRQIPLVARAERASDIEALLRLKAELRIDLVIVGAAEGWLLADALAEAAVPVVVDPLVYGPGGFSQVHGRADNAARLAEAGVTVIIATGSSHNARNLGQLAGNAVRGGMAPNDALRAITAHPARAFGLDDRGELRAGAVADVVVWTGDPLELSSRADQIWIGGVRVPRESRQTHLLDAYRTLPGTPRPPLPVAPDGP